MAEKKSNTPLLAAVAAGIGIFLWRSKKAKAAPITPADLPEVPDIPDIPPAPTAPGGGTGIPSGVIGGIPGYDWQPRTEWPSYGSIIGGLKALDYNVPGDFWQPARAEERSLMKDSKSAIKKFQADYKHAIKFLTAWPQNAGGVVVDGANAPRKTLSADGWMGKNSWVGFKWAYKQATRGGGDFWQDWVKAGKDMG
jgi:hypothetical protein